MSYYAIPMPAYTESLLSIHSAYRHWLAVTAQPWNWSTYTLCETLTVSAYQYAITWHATRTATTP